MNEYIGGSNLRVHDINSLSDMIMRVPLLLFWRDCKKNEFALMLGTAAVESDMQHRKQLGGGPARGIFQMEPGMTGAQDIFKNYLGYQKNPRRKKLWKNLAYIWLGLKSVPYFTPSEEDLGYSLMVNDPFACAMARLKYLRVPAPIPSSLPGLADYWKLHYNTVAGAGTTEEFLQKWMHFGCNEMVRHHFGTEMPLEVHLP